MCTNDTFFINVEKSYYKNVYFDLLLRIVTFAFIIWIIRYSFILLVPFWFRW